MTMSTRLAAPAVLPAAALLTGRTTASTGVPPPEHKTLPWALSSPDA